MHNKNNTGFEHNPDKKTEAKSKRPRRSASHTLFRVTDAGEYMACGHFIPKGRIIDIKTYTGPIEFHPCPKCETIARLEKEMKGHWPKFLIPADMALDLADRWEANE